MCCMRRRHSNLQEQASGGYRRWRCGSGDSAMEEARYVQGVEDHAAEKGVLGGLKVKNVVTGDVSDLIVSGLFFAIGHEPATKFLDGKLELDEDVYVVTKPGTTKTSVVGVFAAGDV
ncbi:hypothetical protein YC2023_042520 [Brassica napus]|uniref:(rape) hypothetical protein n=1 Tax=Brassica napus TaxID=3708 RepID=A0A816IIB3_BRANA|nr:unnamed protein product [Brassica napus]